MCITQVKVWSRVVSQLCDGCRVMKHKVWFLHAIKDAFKSVENRNQKIDLLDIQYSGKYFSSITHAWYIIWLIYAVPDVNLAPRYIYSLPCVDTDTEAALLMCCFHNAACADVVFYRTWMHHSPPPPSCVGLTGFFCLGVKRKKPSGFRRHLVGVDRFDDITAHKPMSSLYGAPSSLCVCVWVCIVIIQIWDNPSQELEKTV